jgi:hypothetical protein
MVSSAQVTLLDQWQTILIPKQPLSQDNKLRSIGSHPQKVTSKEELAKIRDDLLGSTYIDEISAGMVTAPEGSGLTFSNEAMLKGVKSQQKSVKPRLKHLLDNPRTEVFKGLFQSYFSLGQDGKTTYEGKLLNTVSVFLSMQKFNYSFFYECF